MLSLFEEEPLLLAADSGERNRTEFPRLATNCRPEEEESKWNPWLLLRLRAGLLGAEGTEEEDEEEMMLLL